jgi:thioredoxin-like negative regulator of GroEL
LLGFNKLEEVNIALGMLRSLNNPPFLDQVDHQERHTEQERTLQQRLSFLQQKEQLDQIDSVYRAAIQHRPDDWQLHYIYANFLTEHRDYKAAAEHLKVVVSSFPRVQPMRFTLATALVNSGQVSEGLEELSAILRLDPEYAPAKAALARIQSQSDPFRRRP